MERAGGQRNKPKVWQIPSFSGYRSTCGSPSKTPLEKRRLSLRSDNTDAAKTSSTTTSQFSFRQATILAQKQPGKENESPLGLQDYGGKSCATIAKSTIKRKKPSNLGYITNSEKKIIKRRLSADYEDQLSSTKLFEPIHFPSEAIRSPKADFINRHDVKTRFSVYDDEEEAAADLAQASKVITKEDSKEKFKSHGAGTPCGEVSENYPSATHRVLHVLWKSYQHCGNRTRVRQRAEEHIETVESSATKNNEEETSGVEFLIERVDPNEGRTPSMNSYRKVKSGSDIGRLNVPLKRGADISPFKRRMNQLKRSATIVGKSLGIEKKPPKRQQAAVVITQDAKKQTRSGRKVDFDQASRGAKSKIEDTKNPRLLDEILPWEIHYTTDYTKESVALEDSREKHAYKISRTFLKGKSVTPEQRRIVVSFLISVHAYLLTGSSTLYQATRIFDAILDIKDVSVKELQLVALAASWIAIKNTESKVPSACEMISFAKDMYHAEGPELLCKCERKILKTLGFNIRFPDPFYISAHYLQRWSSSGTVAHETSILKIIHHSTGYLMDVALLDENYSSMPSALLAAAATQTAVHLVLNTSWKGLKDNSPWNDEQPNIYTEAEINRIAGPLIKGVLDSAEKDSSASAVYKKYKSARYDNTSDYLIMKIKKLPANPKTHVK